MHWPAPMTEAGEADKSVGCAYDYPNVFKLTPVFWQIDWLDTWKAMEKVYKAHPDKLKAIGVSNFSVTFLRELLKIATIVPAVNQIESHP